MKTAIYTIGHSSHPIDHFIRLLKQNHIAVIIDVRSIPASRRHPQFNRHPLDHALAACGIAYIHMGQQLGALTKDPAMMENGRVSFPKIAASQPFKTALSQVAQIARTRRTALMCAEKDPLSCHRTLLVSRRLEKTGIDILHILADGACETHHDTMTRLLKTTGAPETDLFLTRENLIDQAAAIWEANILKKRN